MFLHSFPLGCLYSAVNYGLQLPGLEGHSVLPEDDHTALLASPQTSMVPHPLLLTSNETLGSWGLNQSDEPGAGAQRVPSP